MIKIVGYPERAKNLVNMKFGLLTVVACCGKDDRNKIYWDCICDCGGSRRMVFGYYLTSGAYTRCVLCRIANNKNGRWNGGRPKKGVFPKSGFGKKPQTIKKYKKLFAKMLRETGDIC